MYALASSDTQACSLGLQILEKEEVVERLMRDKEEMASKLGLAEHQVALLQAGGGEEERELVASEALLRKNAECESLKAQ